MANLTDLAQSQNLKIMIYSESGCGKTCFLSTAPGPILALDFDNKISSLASYLKTHNPEKLKEVEYEAYTPEIKDKLRPYQRFEAKLKQLESDAVSGKFKYKTVALDSLTTFSECLMNEMLIQNPTVKRFFANVPVMQDYLNHGVQFRNVVERVLSLPCDVVVMAHINVEKDEHTGIITGKALLPGKLSAYIPRIFPEVYRAYVERDKDGKSIHVAQTRPDGKYVVRTQIPEIPAIVPLDFSKIKALLNKEIKV